MDSEGQEYAEGGRKTHMTGSKQMNLGIIYSIENRLPFCYIIYSGSATDVATIDNIIFDFASIGCRPVELEMDRSFFSAGNVELMISHQSGLIVPIPVRNGILKELILESIGKIELPLNSDCLAGGVVIGYEVCVKLEDDEFVKVEVEEGAIRAVIFQDDTHRRRKSTPCTLGSQIWNSVWMARSTTVSLGIGCPRCRDSEDTGHLRGVGWEDRGGETS